MDKPKGDLIMTIADASFQNSTMRDRLIAAAGRAVQQSITGKGSCYTATLDMFEMHGTVSRKETVCNVCGDIQVNWYSGQNVYGPDDYLWLQFKFDSGPDAEDVTDEVCEATMAATDFLAALAAIIFSPSALVDETVAKDAAKAGCDAAKAADNAANAIQDA